MRDYLTWSKPESLVDFCTQFWTYFPFIFFHKKLRVSNITSFNCLSFYFLLISFFKTSLMNSKRQQRLFHKTHCLRTLNSIHVWSSCMFHPYQSTHCTLHMCTIYTYFTHVNTFWRTNYPNREVLILAEFHVCDDQTRPRLVSINTKEYKGINVPFITTL